jgi:hypothetical protein
LDATFRVREVARGVAAQQIEDSDNMATVIDGNEIAKTIREELTVAVSEMKASHGKVPGRSIRVVIPFTLRGQTK